MKKILLVIIIISSISSVKAQNSEFEEKKISILKEISKSQEQLQSIIKLGTLNDTPLKFSSGVSLHPEPIELPPLQMNFEELKSKIKASKWEQHVIDNQTIISLEKTIFGDYPNVNIKEIVLENIKFITIKRIIKK